MTLAGFALLQLADRYYRRKKFPGGKSMVVVSLCLTIAYLTYGTVNMQVIQPNEHTYTSDKLTHEYTFVFLSDLHYGSAQSEKTVDNALAKIAQLKLVFVLLGGDITDENTTAEEMRSIYTSSGRNTGYVLYHNRCRRKRAPSDRVYCIEMEKTSGSP